MRRRLANQIVDVFRECRGDQMNTIGVYARDRIAGISVYPYKRIFITIKALLSPRPPPPRRS